MGPKYPQGTMRIADQVIEEVDEQLTVTSNRGVPEKRPTAQSLFATNNEKLPVRSEPIAIQQKSNHNSDKIGYDRVQSVAPDHSPYLFPNNEFFSTSAPEENFLHATTPKISVNFVNNSKGSNDMKVSSDLKASTPLTSGKDGRKIKTFRSGIHFNRMKFVSGEEDVDCTTEANTPNDKPSDDDFEQLRIAREKERLERQKQKIARSVSQQTGGVPIDTELLIEKLTNSKGDGINRASYIDPNS